MVNWSEKQIETYEKKPIHVTEDINLDRYKESDSFKIRHEKLKEQVLSILKTDVKARKDDFWLCLLLWIKKGHIKFVIPLEEFHKINKPESISRCRRKLIEEAKKGDKKLSFLLNDQETLKEREEERINYKEYYATKKTL